MPRYSKDWMDGFSAGYREAQEAYKDTRASMSDSAFLRGERFDQGWQPKKPKRKQSGKAKILTAMTAPVWKKYKKGSGKKTYVQIRAQVSRSQAYKRKVRNL